MAICQPNDSIVTTYVDIRHYDRNVNRYRRRCFDIRSAVGWRLRKEACHPPRILPLISLFVKTLQCNFLRVTRRNVPETLNSRFVNLNMLSRRIFSDICQFSIVLYEIGDTTSNIFIYHLQTFVRHKSKIWICKMSRVKSFIYYFE